MRNKAIVITYHR